MYIDCYRGAAAVPAGLLPGVVCVLYIALAKASFFVRFYGYSDCSDNAYSYRFKLKGCCSCHRVVLRRVEKLLSRSGSGQVSSNTTRLVETSWYALSEISFAWQVYCKFLPCSSLSIGLGGAMESAVAAMSADEAAAWREHSTVAMAGQYGARKLCSTQIESVKAMEEEGWAEQRPRRFLSELVMPPDGAGRAVRSLVCG